MGERERERQGESRAAVLPRQSEGQRVDRCRQLDIVFLICPNRVCPMEAFLPNSRPGTGVVTARRQHGTTAVRDDTTAVCVCKREQYVHLCEEEKAESLTTRQAVKMSASLAGRSVR